MVKDRGAELVAAVDARHEKQKRPKKGKLSWDETDSVEDKDVNHLMAQKQDEVEGRRK